MTLSLFLSILAMDGVLSMHVYFLVCLTANCLFMCIYTLEFKECYHVYEDYLLWFFAMVLIKTNQNSGLLPSGKIS